MRKLLYGFLLFLLVVCPISVFADGGIDVDTKDLTIVAGGNKSVTIEAHNVVGDVSIKSNDTSVVTVGSSTLDINTANDAMETKLTKTYTVNVKAVGVGTTTLTLDFDCYTYDDDENSEIKKTHTINVVVTENIDGYTVSYEANGGKDAPVAQTKKEGVELTLDTAKPTKDGYDFIGWNTQKDGKGKSYEAGGKYTEDKNVTLYAMWKAKNVKDNPNTGDTMIYVVLLLTLGALIYSYWYMKKSQEN